MARKTCTPFCDTKKTCPKHHDLLLTLINCSDRKDQDANACFEEFQSTVKAYLKKGWNVDDVIPDPVRKYRFPLLHWAGVMGKTRALEWMIKFGFGVTICTSDSQETALHRTVLCLQFSNRRRFREKIKRLVHLLKDCLSLQDKAMQTPLHAAAVKLVTDIPKADYYSEFVKEMVAKAVEIPGKTAEILNAKDHHGNTVLHYLAQSDTGLAPLCSIVNAGGDVSILNKKKLRPLDLAMNMGCTSIIKALNSSGKTSNPSCNDNIVYSADSPPASPVNLPQSSENHQDDALNSSEVGSQPDLTHSNNADTPSLECNEDSSFSTSVSEDVSLGEPSCAMSEVLSANTATAGEAPNPAPGSTADDAALAADAANTCIEVLQTTCSEISCDNHGDSQATLDALSVNMDEAGSLCEAGENHLERECRCNSIGMQAPVLNQYSCIVHIKQEHLSQVSCLICLKNILPYVIAKF